MNRIKEMRIKCKKTQQEIAELLCINRTTYTKWENGTHTPDVNSLQKLAGIFRTTMSYLLEETDDPSRRAPGSKTPATNNDDGLSPERRKLIKLLTELTPEDAVRAEAYLQGLIDSRKQ